MAKTVADDFVEHLVQAGVRRIYGVVGDSLNPVVDAVRRTEGIDWIHVRHEEAGAFAAGAEAQLTGRLAACAGSCGPGHVHLVNGLYDCHRSGAPVLAIAAHIQSHEVGTNFFQETHPEILFKECSHYCEHMSTPKQMPRVLQIAMQEAIGRQGVGVVVLSGDVAAQPTANPAFSHLPFLSRPSIRPSDDDVAALAEVIEGAEKITLFCGIGCEGAHREVMALAEALQAPVGHSMRGKDAVQPDNPYDVGMSGLLGYGAAYRAMHECDLLLMLGTDWPYENFLPTKCKIVQVDVRPERLGRRSRLDLGVWGDVRETIRALLPKLRKRTDGSFLDAMLKDHHHALEKLRVYVDHLNDQTPIHPEPVAAILDELADDDAIFCVDTGMCNVWAARYLHAKRGRRIIGSYTHGSMANALPQAIGAQLAFPDRQVITLSGDGGFSMLMGDFLTLVQYNLPVKMVVFNNGTLGMVRLEMLVGGYPFHGTEMKNPDFGKVAEAMGATGIRVEDPKDLREALRKALTTPGPVLVDVVTDPNALSMPPQVTFEQAKGFAAGLGKMALSGHIDEVFEQIKSNRRNLL